MEALAEYVRGVGGTGAGLSVFAFLLTFGFCSPIPEELALLAAGFVLRSAGLPFPAALAISLSALILSDSACYGAFRLLGPRLLRVPALRKRIGPERLAAAESGFARYGARFVFGCRFLVGLRSLATIASGLLKLPYRDFLGNTFAALAIGGSVWLGAGFLLGSRLDGSLGAIAIALTALAFVAAGILSIAILRRLSRARGSSGSAATDDEAEAA